LNFAFSFSLSLSASHTTKKETFAMIGGVQNVTRNEKQGGLVVFDVVVFERRERRCNFFF